MRWAVVDMFGRVWEQVATTACMLGRCFSGWDGIYRRKRGVIRRARREPERVGADVGDGEALEDGGRNDKVVSVGILGC